MEVGTESRVLERPKEFVFNPLGGQHYDNSKICSFWLAGTCNRNPCRFRHHYGNSKICSFWLAGTCNRNPCRFLHVDLPNPQPQLKPKPKPKQSHWTCESGNKFKSTWGNPDLSYSKNVRSSSTGGVGTEGKVVQVIKSQVLTSGRADSVGGSCQTAQKKLCQYWINGNCVHGEQCKDLHSLFSGSGLSLLTKLERHSKAVSGIVLPSGSDKLFSGSKDESVCIWDCHTGQCISTAKLSSEIGCLISEGPWVFVGLQDAVKAWNIETQTELVLSGPNGLVHTMVVGEDMLFGGVQDGSILAWKSTSDSSSPQLVATLEGHRLAVLCLVVGAGCLYSGSKDGSIRVWDVKTLQCLHVLNAHTSSVTSVLCWDTFLLSGSLDNTLKVWAASENGNLEVVYEVEEQNGILALCGIHDAEAKPILLCSCKDNSVRLYDLPSFAERGRIFAKGEVQTISVGCGTLFFTGDATGQLSVWKMLGEPSEGAGAS